MTVNIIQLAMRENERLMKLGREHMTIAELRFIVAGVCGSNALAAFDREVEAIKRGHPAT